VYEEDAEAMRERAPDRRVFLFETSEGEVRAIRGYRGDSGLLSRRGLPVCDACLLANLVWSTPGAMILDPFAGIGGIVVEALANGYLVVSTDLDPVLRHGLAYLGALHCVADASALPFASATFDAIATEPPYHEQAQETVLGSLREMHRVLKAGGRLALLCALSQADALRREAAASGFESYLDTPINRKGLDVVAFAWQKPNP
jgi:SAM-dependent methyltransferase